MYGFYNNLVYICFLILQQFHFHIKTEYENYPHSHSHKNKIFCFPLGYFNEVELGYIFQNQGGYFDQNMVKQILRDQFIHKWHSDINNTSRGPFYSGFKNYFCLENYLLRLSEYNRR
jgi:hypothetical protein